MERPTTPLLTVVEPMKAKTHVALEHIVSFGGERMTYGEMIRRLQQTARATGHPKPQLLVDRYLQGWMLLQRLRKS
jgi:hypothetical protein